MPPPLKNEAALRDQENPQKITGVSSQKVEVQIRLTTTKFDKLIGILNIMGI